VKRREFITLIGGAAVVGPRGAWGQQGAMPVIGFLSTTSPDGYTERLRGFHSALKESGYVEGENIAIEYRWADNQPERLAEQAAELVRRRVAVIATAGGQASAFAAKAATATIPIVFVVPEDPVRLGLVASLAQPGGNLTGVNLFIGELTAKRLEFLRELVPAATRIAVLVNPVNAAITETTLRDVEPAARAMGLQIRLLSASSAREIDAAFASFVGERPDALLLASDPYFVTRRIQIVQLAAHSSIPAIYATRIIAEVGGLMSYGASFPEAFRQVGVYTGRILKGAKPADMPVVQSNKFELLINAQTARMLGLTVPSTLLARADEVIE
jgi:putative tryptophan/tyrosine transport system substrate-binding protein